MFKVIIAGGRDFNNYPLLCQSCNKILSRKTDIEIVSGAAGGADRMGERYAKAMGYKISSYPADWSIGRSAGYKRNKEMAEYADALIAFWDGKSKGTKHMIDLAREYGLKVRVILY
jgi:predicted Rossmann fold nucleotide-binding protein DprA/Smf involved in DNA uptake